MPNFVVDVTFGGDGIFCFVPVEFGPGGEVESLLIGMNYLSSEPPHGGRVVGIIHSDGDDAVETWIAGHPVEYARIAAMAV